MKKIIWMICRSFFYTILAILLFCLIIEPFFRAWHLRSLINNALDDATSVEVVEHSNKFDKSFMEWPNYHEITYGTVNLTPSQIEFLRKALPLSFDYSGFIDIGCIFVEHHYIKITEHDGKTLVLHLCFQCGQIQINNTYGTIMPLGWSSSLSTFITGLGLRPHGPFKTTSANYH